MLPASLPMKGRAREASSAWGGKRRFTSARRPAWGSPGEDRRHYGRLPRRPNPALAGAGDERRARELKIAAAGACPSARLQYPAGWLNPGRPGGSIPAGASEAWAAPKQINGSPAYNPRISAKTIAWRCTLLHAILALNVRKASEK